MVNKRCLEIDQLVIVYRLCGTLNAYKPALCEQNIEFFMLTQLVCIITSFLGC
jgi:hypothetical protein